MRAPLLAAALLLLAACVSTASESDPASVVTQFMQAFNDLDSAAVASLFARDATAYLPFATSGARIDGRDAIVAALEPMFTAEKARKGGAPPYLQLAARDLHVQRLGADVAVAAFDVGNEHVFSRRTLVLRRTADGWRIAHLHASNVRP